MKAKPLNLVSLNQVSLNTKPLNVIGFAGSRSVWGEQELLFDNGENVLLDDGNMVIVDVSVN